MGTDCWAKDDAATKSAAMLKMIFFMIFLI
jgi:hypothetical protein